MKKNYLIALSFFMYCGVNAQNLYVVNDVNFDSEFFIKELNPQTGATLSTQALTSFTNNYGPVSLDYLPATNEIIGRIAYYINNSLWKYNVQTKAETLLPVASSVPLVEIIVANNRIFAVSDKEVQGIAPAIQEIDGSTGNVLSSYDFNSGGDYCPISLSFMPSTNTIFGIIP